MSLTSAIQTVAVWAMLLSGVLTASAFTTWWAEVRDASPHEWPDPVWRILYGCSAASALAVVVVVGTLLWSRR